jgi:hypothetical protein
MTPATETHPLSKSRRLFLTESARLERCRAAYHAMGQIDEALKLERLLDYMGESVRILDGLIAATGGEGQ